MTALEYAISIIENYESDIRALTLPPGHTITCGFDGNFIVPCDKPAATAAEAGFCQGAIYRDAIATIKKHAAAGTTL